MTTRAGYFHYGLIVWSIKRKKNCEKCLSLFPKAQSNFYMCLVLSDQQSKTPRYKIYYKVRPKKAAYSSIWETGNQVFAGKFT